MVTLHVIAPFHSRVLRDNSACAFSGGNVLRFPKMMRPFGFRVVEYHPGSTSDSDADEHVSITSDEEWGVDWGDSEGKGISPTIDSPGAMLFAAKLLPEINRRIRKGDIICHPYGDAHSSLLWTLALKLRHVEIAIGYDRGPFGAERIFPSEAWRHWQFGKYMHSASVMGESAAIFHYFDTEEWTVNTTPGEYVLYAGRLIPSKYGCLPQLVRERDDLKWKIAGSGDASPFQGMSHVELLGVVKGKERDALYGNARAIVCPTEFVEPFGAVAIEANFTGTPCVVPNYGAYVETVACDINGIHAHGEGWGRAIDRAVALDRNVVASHARGTFCLEEIGRQYAEFFNRG
jgi:glycosyltransferase involved in cell wall biosynthesis